jgi:hypothetical protein
VEHRRADVGVDAQHHAGGLQPVEQLSSASSGAAVGLAWLLTRRGSHAVRLTSARNAKFVTGPDLYGQIVGHDWLEDLRHDGRATFVDMAGSAAVRADVYRVLVDRLDHSVVAGSTLRHAKFDRQVTCAGRRL